MKVNTGTKPEGKGTHEFANEYKKFTTNYCKTCKFYDTTKFFPCTANAPKEYTTYRYGTAKGKDCKVFESK